MSTHARTPQFKVGDRVAYSVQFLAAIGESHSDLARDRGFVVSTQPLGQKTLVSINWDGDSPRMVLACNLAHVGLNTRFCQC